MSDITSGTVSIDAPKSEVEKLLFNIAEYPTWSKAIKSVEVLATDEKGRATSAKLVVDAGMMKDKVVLDYEWGEAPGKVTFSLSDADILTAMDGTYLVSGDEEQTTVTYTLNVELSMPLPAMMRHKAEQTVIDTALAQLKASAEM